MISTDNQKKLIFPAILIMAMILYGNTIGHDYALDDSIVITENEFTQQGLSGIKDIFTHDSFTGFFGEQKQLVSGGRYRPLSIASFAVEYEIWGLQPHISHFINILLYAFCVYFLYLLLIFAFPSAKKTFLNIPVLTSLFFLAHPLHTEVVANIKGRDELFALFFALSASILLLKSTQQKGRWLQFLGSILFFLGLLSKENSATFLLLTPLVMWVSKKDEENYKTRDYTRVIFPMLLSAFVYFIIRHQVVGPLGGEGSSELLNNPFVEAGVSEKYATIFFTLLLYIKLLIVPSPLTHDYYPYHIPLMQWDNWTVILSVVLYVTLISVALYYFIKRKKAGLIFWFYLIPLSIVSNIVFPVGSFMNERFIFFSSIGFCLLVAYLIYTCCLVKEQKSFQYAGKILTVLIILVYAWISIDRNRDWKDNFTLFTHDVHISKNSTKANTSAGGVLFEKAAETEEKNKEKEYIEQGFSYLKKALDIYPENVNALILLGNGYFNFKQKSDSTFYFYKKVLKKAPGNSTVYNNTASILAQIDNPEYSLRIYESFYAFAPNRFDLNYQLGKLYGQHRYNYSKSVSFLKKAYQLRPNHYGVIKDLSVALALNKEYEASISLLKKAIQMQPGDPSLYINMGINYRKIGNQEKAASYFEEAQKLQKNTNEGE